MPAKNRIKQYTQNGYYHIYNRGTEKRKIFLDKQDYNVFISYLKEYLLPKNEQKLLERLSDPDITRQERERILRFLRLNNFCDEILLHAYCLMSNHFHFFIKQKSAGTIDKFMNSLGTRYTMYFNKKYKRVGSLYQGVYKAVLIKSDGQFLHLTRYIHAQALPYQPSSYKNYLQNDKSDWIHPEDILKYFSTKNPRLSYRSFVEADFEPDIIQDIVLEELHL